MSLYAQFLSFSRAKMYGETINETKYLLDFETFANESLTSFNESVLLQNLTDANSIAPNKGIQKFELIYFVSVSLLGFLLNLRVTHIAGNAPRGVNRQFNDLTAHLSCVTLVSIALAVLLIVNQLDIVNVCYPGVCELLEYLQYAVSASFALNVSGIMFERVRTFRYPTELFCAGKVIKYNWILVLMASIPTFLTVEYYEDPLTHEGSCKQVPLAGLIEATITFESAWFWGFHVLIVGHVGYALFKICNKFKYLKIFKPISNENTRQDLHQIHFTYLTGINFTVMWIPIGFLHFLHNVLSRHEYVPDFSVFLRSALHLQFLYYLLNPLQYLCLMTRGSVFNMFCCRPNIPINDAIRTEEVLAPTIIETELQDTSGQNKAGCSTTKPIHDGIDPSTSDEKGAKKKVFPKEKRFPGWHNHKNRQRYHKPTDVLATSSFSTVLAITDSTVAFAFQQSNAGCYNLVYPEDIITAADLERLSLQRDSETLI